MSSFNENETYESDSVELDFRKDPRVQWIKKSILNYIGMEDEDLFYSMLEQHDTKRKLTGFLTADIPPTQLSPENRVFYVSKIIVDKLVHVEKEFVEWRIIEPPPPPPAPASKKKKGKKEKEADPAAIDKKIKSGKGKKKGK
ncbi:uncharacterized protein LOC125489997 [Plutella xylostella]|uniref:uncharacterized protein LOC125489997 n=1 Tax=Plutella xylostella TaxID=51655 RepID=UPI0020325BD2|nr:uncharacterized protein LOC125489997 [Plutella xylostella]